MQKYAHGGYTQKSSCFNNKTIKKPEPNKYPFYSGGGLTFMLCYSNFKMALVGGW